MAVQQYAQLEQPVSGDLMPTDAIGLTLIVADGEAAIPVYESVDGLETFATDDPYLLSDGQTFLAPLPVFDAGGATWIDADGNAHDALAVTVVPEV